MNGYEFNAGMFVQHRFEEDPTTQPASSSFFHLYKPSSTVCRIFCIPFCWTRFHIYRAVFSFFTSFSSTYKLFTMQDYSDCVQRITKKVDRVTYVTYASPINFICYTLYAPCHKSCPLVAFEIIEKLDTFCGREHTWPHGILPNAII
jgi:hypothetical protein